MKKSLIYLSVLLPLVSLVLFLRTFTGSVVAKPQMIDVGGSISTDTTWTFANSPYTITDTVTVEAGVTLTIEAGVTVMTTVEQYLIVQGHLEAVGTAVAPILFTSIDNLNTNSWTGPNIIGSANFENVTMRYADFALVISGSGGGDVFLANSLFEENSAYPIVAETEALHRLQMTNVTFQNNTVNRILVDTSGGQDAIIADVTLTSQPGLEWYEFDDASYPQPSPRPIAVPEGITLTVESGVELRFGDSVEQLVVNGHLQANGTQLAPVIFDYRSGSGIDVPHYLFIAETGSASLVHTIIRNGSSLGLGIDGQSDEPVILQDVVLDNVGDYPLIVSPPSLHRLQMTNVTFQNNTVNRILVDTSGGQDAIIADVTLTSQPGLEWYEFVDGTDPQTPPGQFLVPNGITLTVASGVELRFGTGAEEFLVNGRLQAIGTQIQPVTFTSAADSAPDQWYGMMVENGSAQLDYVDVRYAENNISVNNTAVSNTVLLENSQIHHGASAGLSVLDGTVAAVCTTFNNNGITGIVVWDTGNPSVQISSSSLVGNSDSGLLNNNIAPVDARNNWWGDATGPAGIGSGSGDAVLGDVLFAPWLPEETCTTVPYRLYLPSVIKP